ncbi:L-lactate permease [Thermodesulfovibrio sp. 3907-1M]|uniref:L-lactate permease n=1 Tax=Thermodesulfovibrio autotrophicus TaxID=3118333 RepID=A0AAU8GZ99_9BACT
MDFFLAIFPILVVLIGMLVFYRSGSFVSVVGWVLAVIVAVYYFKTPWNVVWGATLTGIVKAFGISLAVVFTMFLIFLMRETGALKKIIEYVKGIARNKEEQTLFIGMGFGSLSTALGMVTPAMFPPIFLLLGFSPIAAIGVSILCYDPLTSFALFTIPLTLPSKVAMAFGIKPPGIESLNEFIWDYTFKVTVLLPVISVIFAFLMLKVVGGKEAIKKNWKAALISGLVLSFSALIIAGFRILPVEIIGIISGLITMLTVYFIYRRNNSQEQSRAVFNKEVFIACLPFILLIIISLIVNIPSLKTKLENVLGQTEVIRIIADKREDLNILGNVWFWIMFVSFISVFILRPSGKQLSNVFKLWITRIWGPFLAYSLFFAVAFIMAWSAMEVSNGKLVPSQYFAQYNMDRIIGITLANVFGPAYPFIAPFLGLFGAFVGGSETASNVLFAKIQWEATLSTVGANAFMWIYAAHAVGGGIASAITPSKITNAAATIGVGGKEEAQFIKAVLIPVLLMCAITGAMVMAIVYL